MNELFFLGDPELDAQHADLFALMARLAASEHSPSPEESAGFVLGQLGELLFQHFKSEELLMADLALPATIFSRHAEAHMGILEELAHIHWEAMMGQAKPLLDIIAIARRCVEQHLVEFDLMLKPYIARAAAKQGTILTQT